MSLFLLGISHHSAPVDLRERVDFSRRGVPEALSVLAERDGLSEVVILSTCNRSEIYAICENPTRPRAALTSALKIFLKPLLGRQRHLN